MIYKKVSIAFGLTLFSLAVSLSAASSAEMTFGKSVEKHMHRMIKSRKPNTSFKDIASSFQGKMEQAKASALESLIKIKKQLKQGAKLAEIAGNNAEKTLGETAEKQMYRMVKSRRPNQSFKDIAGRFKRKMENTAAKAAGFLIKLDRQLEERIKLANTSHSMAAFRRAKKQNKMKSFTEDEKHLVRDSKQAKQLERRKGILKSRR